MVSSWHRKLEIFEPWRVDAHAISHPCNDSRLIVSDPVLDAVTQRTGDEIGVFHKCFSRGAGGPSAFLFQQLGQVPVKESDKRLDICVKQSIYKFAVEIQTLLIDFTASRREDARPRDREAIGLETQLLHQPDIFFPEAIMIVGHIAGIVVSDLAGCVSKAIPRGLALAVLVPRAFDLIRSGCGSPEKILRENNFICHLILHLWLLG